MIIVNTGPPNIKQIKERLTPPKGTVYCYENFLFNPDNAVIDESLHAHEEVHSEQQKKMGVKEWWNLYLISPEFRISQEMPAHQVQFRVLRKMFKDRNHQMRILNFMAKTLSSEMYGSCISFEDARDGIENEKLFHFSLPDNA